MMMQREFLKTMFMSLIGSVLTCSSFVWFGNFNMKDKGSLSRIVEVATLSCISNEQA